MSSLLPWIWWKVLPRGYVSRQLRVLVPAESNVCPPCTFLVSESWRGWLSCYVEFSTINRLKECYFLEARFLVKWKPIQLNRTFVHLVCTFSVTESHIGYVLSLPNLLPQIQWKVLPSCSVSSIESPHYSQIKCLSAAYLSCRRTQHGLTFLVC